jgi:hypothetical protein
MPLENSLRVLGVSFCVSAVLAFIVFVAWSNSSSSRWSAEHRVQLNHEMVCDELDDLLTNGTVDHHQHTRKACHAAFLLWASPLVLWGVCMMRAQQL